MGLFGWLKKAPEIKKAEFVSPATGKIIPVDQVEDETFASKILGDAAVTSPSNGAITSPSVSSTAKPSPRILEANVSSST